MKIARVTAVPLHVPLHIKLVGVDRKTSLACCHVEVETDDGLIGHGLTSITEEDVIAQIVNGVIAPAIIGDDPLAHERIWDKLYWTLMPRGQTGYAAHALAAVDIALWDIKGKSFKQPVWRLLGGAHPRVPVYATFGFGFFDREQLAAAAKLWVAQGFTRLKMTVGNEALRHRDKRPVMEVIREDAARVRAVREAVGADVTIRLDANQGWTPDEAITVIRALERADLGVELVEQPVRGEDVEGLASVRAGVGLPVMADEALYSLVDLDRIIRLKAADLVNVKLAKCGSLGVAMEQLRRATDAGLGTMVGSMMETAIGVGAVAAVAAAHPTSVVDDLDAAWWAASSPVVGGVTYDGDRLMLPATAGSGVAEVVVTD